MNIVQILGGLGNQMFQYAFYKSLKLNGKAEVKIDISDFETYKLHNGFELSKVFHIDKGIIAKSNEIEALKDTFPFFKIRKKINLLKSTHFIEKKVYKFDEKLLLKDNLYFQGYWQSNKYFENIEQELRNDFNFKIDLFDKNKDIVEKIRNTQSCSIHIRRGDYINHRFFRGICDLEYYQKAIKKIKELYPNTVFFVFSNDVNWCKVNLKKDEEFNYIDWNNAENSFIDMYLMSQCKNNIIANSTFSWWGAWLNINKNKVIIKPKIWINIHDNVELKLKGELII